MKKKTVTSETEEITIDNKKQKRKREKKAYREIRWDRLDNTAHLFPVIAGENMSNVYRISVTLTELVQPDILQQALNIVLPKMDGFNLRLRMGVFWYYFEENGKSAPRVREESNFPCRYIQQNQNHSYMFRVTYYKYRINLEVFHVLTDGMGGINFLKELTYQYLRLAHPEAQIIAGGTDVLVQMREGRRAGKELISIQKVNEIRGICMDEQENIRIGSLTTFSHITHDPIIIERINVLGEAVDMVGGPQIRNAGTIGGNTCNGVTSADSASTLHAWEAIIELTGVNGKRYLPIKDFYIKAGTVDINVAEGEIQTAVLIPKASWENTKGFYIKYGMRNAMEIATTGCSVNVRLSEDQKTFDRVRIAYGVAGPVPMRAPSAEAVVNGQPVTMENIEAFSRAVLEDINPRDSWRASKAFRKHIAVEMAKRALIESVKRCGGEI